jgi:hypothetical protein
MTAQTFARIAGIVFLIVAVAGFLPPLLAPDPTELHMEVLHGRLLGLFPVNLLHTLVHLIIGAWGLWAARRASSAVAFCVWLAIIYGLFAVMGLIGSLKTTFGYVPLYGHDVWLHAVTAALAAWFAVRSRRRAPLQSAAP